MSDARRPHREDDRPARDDRDRRDRPRDHDRDRNRHRDERRGGGGRGLRSRSRDRDSRRGARSRSPDGRQHRNREGDRGGRRFDDRDARDRRRGDDRDRRGTYADRRSRSPPTHPSLPTRPRNERSDAEPRPADPPTRDRDAPGRPDPRDERTPPVRDSVEAMDEDGEVDEDEAAMQAMLGFGGFGTTKGKKIAGNNVGAVKKEKRTEYRQYMNRPGGFNRPLSPGK